MLIIARSGWRRSYHAGFEQVVFDSLVVDIASGTSIVISEGPGSVSVVDMRRSVSVWLTGPHKRPVFLV